MRRPTYLQAVSESPYIDPTQSQKILWAIDPFAEDRKSIIRSAWVTRTFSASMQAKVEPVYLLNTQPLGVPLQTPPEFLLQVQQLGQDILEQIDKEVNIPNLGRLKVIPQTHASIRLATQDLISYAKASRSGLIIMGTRARKGLERFALGSFAETLILHSDVPVVLVNPKWNFKTDLKNIFFPTDFSDASFNAYQQVLKLAQHWKSRITLFHKLSHGLSPMLESAFLAYPVYKKAYEEEKNQREALAEKWSELAKKVGVQTRFLMDVTSPGSAADSILAQAKNQPGIIAMAAQSGAIKSALLGSTTRQVLKASPNPVWIVHPQ